MTRNQSIDIAKAITIILMVIGHCDALNQYFFKFIFSFHMPLFFIFSGYFFRPQKSNDLFKNDLKKLVWPYLYTTIICSMLAIALTSQQAGLNRLLGAVVGCQGSSVAYYKYSKFQAGPIWFLLALFWCRQYFNIIYKNWTKWYLPICFVLSLVFWIFLRKVINIPLCIGAGFTGLMFYATGLFLREWGIDNFKNWHYWVMLVAWILAIRFSYLNMAQYTYHHFYLCIPGAIFGTILVYKFSTFIKGILADCMAFIGQHTLEILCSHTIAFTTRRFFVELFGYDKGNIEAMNIALILLTIIYAVLWISIIYLNKQYGKNCSY